MPGDDAREMAGGKGGGTPTGSVFPRRVYAAGQDRPAGAAERGRNLSNPFPRGVGNAAQHRRRSPAPRRTHRLSGGSAHLGTESSPPSSSSLRGSRRRRQSGWTPLDRVQKEVVLPACEGVEQSLSQSVSHLPAEGVQSRPAEVLRRVGGDANQSAFEALCRTAKQTKWVVFAKPPFG